MSPLRRRWLRPLPQRSNSGALTLPAFEGQLIQQSFNSTIPALVTYDAFFGGIPNSTGLDFLTNYANTLTADGFSLQNIYVNLGASFAEGNNVFTAQYGAMTNATFLTTVYTSIFGVAPTDAQSQYLLGQFSFYQTYFGGSAIAAKGAIYGILLSISDAEPNGKYVPAATQFLEAAAAGDAPYGPSNELIAIYGTGNEVFDVSTTSTTATEGNTVNFNVTTTNVPAGTTYNYTISGVTAAQVANGQLSGTVTISSNGDAIIPVTLTSTPNSGLTGEKLTVTLSIPPDASQTSMPSASVPLTETVQDFNLTTGQDTINVPTNGSSYIINGTVGFGGTLTNGDFVNGTPTTTLDLVVGNSGPAGVADLNNIGVIDIVAAASTTIQAVNWTGIGTVVIDALSSPGTTVTLDNAQVETTYALDASNTASLTVSFRDFGVGSFQLNSSGSSAGGAATLNASAGNMLTGADVATTGTNFDVLDFGTKDTSIVISGNGTNDFTFGALAAGVSVDFHTDSSNQTYTFAYGALDDNNTITGGSGHNTITSDGTTGTDALHMSGVQTFITTMEGGATFDGSHVTGLVTLIANQPNTVGTDTFTNMPFSFTTLDVNGPVDLVSVGYGTVAPDLTVTYGPGNGSPDGGAAADLTDFKGLTVSNVTDVTVNFGGGASFTNMTGAVAGTVTVDNVNTTSLTLDSTGSNGAYVNLTGLDALQNLTVEATGNSSSMVVENLYPVILHGNANTVTIAASGASSYAAINTELTVDNLTTLTVTASGGHSTADIASGFYASGAVSTINISATGAHDSAYIDYGAHIAGNVGSVAVLASGNSSFAGIYSDEGAGPHVNVADAALYVGGSLDPLTITASGASSSAVIGGGSAYNNRTNFGGDGVYVADNLSTATITASGDGASAGIYGGNATYASVSNHAGAGLYVGHNLSTLTITASGDHSDAYIAGGYAADGHTNYGGTGVYVGNSLGTLTITASGEHSLADINGEYESGNAGYAKTNYGGDGVFVKQNLTALTVTASGEHSTADIYAGSAYHGENNAGGTGVAVGGVVSSLTVTATAGGASAYIGGGDASGGEHNFGGDGVFVDDGLSQLTITASGVYSSAGIYGGSAYSGHSNHGGTGVAVNNDVGTIALLASASHSTAYIEGGDAYYGVSNYGGNGVYVDGSLTTLTLTATGSSSSAYIYGGDVNVTDTGNGVYVADNLDTLTLTASGHSSNAHIDYGGYTTNGASGLGVYVGGNLGTLTLTASGSSSYAYIDGGVNVEGSVGSVIVQALGSHATAGEDDSGNYTYIDAHGGVGSATITANGTDAYANVTIDTYTKGLGSVAISAAGSGAAATLSYTNSAAAGHAGLGTVAVSAGSGATVNLYTYLEDSQSGVITGSGSGTFDLYLGADGTGSHSITSVDTSAMSGAFNMIVEPAGCRVRGHDDHHRQWPELYPGRYRCEHHQRGVRRQ